MMEGQEGPGGPADAREETVFRKPCVCAAAHNTLRAIVGKTKRI